LKKVAIFVQKKVNMNTIYEIIIGYAVAINVFTWILFGIDKWKAQRNKWRIPEATLLTCAAVGGSIGALCGMYLFHHKTKHKKFFLGVPFILFLQIAAIVYFYADIRQLIG
jgi:uncharacterized membrane protein YsdA (DUF1294 family)